MTQMIYIPLIILGFIFILELTLNVLLKGNFLRSLQISKEEKINAQARYQIIRLILSAIFTVAILLVFQSSRSYFSFGNIRADAQSVSWLFVGEGQSWRQVGRDIGIVITGVTFIYILSSIRWQWRRLLQAKHIAWILIFAALNALLEELVYRFGIVGPLVGVISSEYIAVISAAAFGAAHWKGVPKGLPGILLAGILGFILAKSVLETGGLFWAWFIHFLQDVVIFGGMFVGPFRENKT